MSGRVTVKIDRLVLRGVDAANRDALVRGLAAELERVLADPAMRAALVRSNSTPVLRLAALRMEPGIGGAHRLGVGIARGIGKGV
jgi:hypothetical protein